MMDFRNPVFSSPDNSTIDAEVSHPSLGWIPFTAVSGDESTQEMFDAMLPGAAPYVAPAIRPYQVDAERDRRIADGIVFEGVEYQTRPQDRTNLSDAALAARDAVADGFTEGDYRWETAGKDFEWIAADNTRVRMDAPTVLRFANAMISHKRERIFAARTIKDMDPVPTDFADDSYWPTAL